MCEQCNQSDLRITRLECKYEELSKTVSDNNIKQMTTESENSKKQAKIETSLEYLIKAIDELKVSIITLKEAPSKKLNALEIGIIISIATVIVGMLFKVK